MNLPWTTTQAARLRELEAEDADLDLTFDDADERNRRFQRLERQLVDAAKARLDTYRTTTRRPSWCRLQSALEAALVADGFVQVTTPTLMARRLLERMGIDEKHPLFSQIYWVDPGKCLRPMLAPHLYYVLVDLLRLWERPVRLFEVGSCFRRESQGSRHTGEFTMLNVVEMGLPREQRRARLEQITAIVMTAAGIADYRLATTSSEVYGETIDVERGRDGLELGSAAMGPHPLDAAWRIDTTWIGVGFGLERLLMATGNRNSLGRLGRSLTYLDGTCLSL